MSRKILILTMVLCTALVLALVPIVVACAAPKAKPGQVLKVGMMNPTTGPAAEKGSVMTHANLDAIKYINDELGGAGGYPIEVLALDSRYDATQAVVIVKRFMDEGCLLFTTASSKEMSAAMTSANEAGFPGISCFSAPSLYRPPKHIYGQTPDYGDDALAFANFYMKNIWKGQGKPKFALHLLNNPTGYGARDAFRAKAEELGIEIVPSLEKPFEHTATTTSEMDSVTNIKSMNPDVIYISSTPAPTAVILKNLYATYGKEAYQKLTIGCAHASFTKALIDLAGADVVEGVYGTFPTVLWGDDVPGMAKMTEYCQKLHPANYGNMDYITSWAQSLIVAEILKLVVKNAGYDVLAKGDAAAWKAVETQGFHKLNNYNVGGLQGSVSYTPGDNRLTKYNRIYQIKGGKIGSPSDWIEAPMVKYEEYPWFGK
ncbi:MAG: amino acid ABC transporter substrate-binding protein [Chloroflexi bacterium]|nr:amino acid ABC transporter substrate-binding protein [Chloroflexota bacterium]MBM4453810.1 amino acid ABC transporter substrate-binding protein [Chloroflexota bacterium]